MFEEISQNLPVLSFLTFINSFLLIFLAIPRILHVLKQLNLNENPNDRSSHHNATPTMAGVSFFLAFIMTLFFIQHHDQDQVGLNLIASLTLIFMAGLKDDLVSISPLKKLLFQIAAVLFMLFAVEMQVISLHGFFGIYELPLYLSYSLVSLVMLTIINAINLIDGLDGLASFIVIVISSVFSLIFFATGHYYYFLLTLSIIGMLLAYLNYNFSHTQKIFMGDTGSLLMGFMVAFFTLKYLSMEEIHFKAFTFKPENELIVLAAIVSVPLFDVVRVMGIRILNGKSPFYPDRNHIHHILSDKGFKHYEVSLILGGLNYFIVIVTIFLASKLHYIWMLGFLFSTFAALVWVFYKLKKTTKKIRR